MSFDAPMRQTAWDVVLRWAVLGGGVFDLLFGVAVLIAWRGFLTMLGIPLPADEAFVKLAGVLSIGVGMMLVVAGLAPWRYHAVITCAALMRLFSGGLLLWLVLVRHVLPQHILIMAGVEGLMGVLHFIYSRRTAAAAAGPQ